MIRAQLTGTVCYEHQSFQKRRVARGSDQGRDSANCSASWLGWSWPAGLPYCSPVIAEHPHRPRDYGRNVKLDEVICYEECDMAHY